MAFPFNSEHEISFERAAEMTKRYRESISPGERIAGYFSASALVDLLNQKDALGIRFYFSLNDENQMQIVAVGVNEAGNDLVGEDYLCMDMAIPCPQNCSENNILNT